MEACNPEAILAAQAALRMERKLLAAAKADPVRFYSPHAKQDDFHRAGGHSRRAVFAGNRFGKSHLGAAEDGAWLRGERAWYPQSDAARRLGIPQRPVKGLVICADWDKVGEIWTEEGGVKPGKIWSMLPRGFVKKKTRSSNGVIDFLLCKNESLLRFETVKSFQNNPLGTESSDWDFIHVDEPCPQKMFTAAARGLVDRKGFAWFTLTAISEPWIVDYFIDNDFWYEYGSIYDNPHNTLEAIKEFELLLDDDEKECRLYGKPLHMAGLVYKQFTTDFHVLKTLPLGWTAYDRPPRDYTIYVRIDTHPQVPHAVLFCAVSPTGHRFYYDEIFAQLSIVALSGEIKKRTVGYQMGTIKVEPAAWVLDPISKVTSVAREFAAAGLPVLRSSKDLSGGIVKVKQSLGELPPRLHFSPLMKRTLWEIKRYCWDPKGTNKPIDTEDHMMENLYRMEIDNPRWCEPGTETEEWWPDPMPLASLSTADFDDSLDLELNLTL